MFEWLNTLFQRGTLPQTAPHLEAVAAHEGYPHARVPHAHLSMYGGSPWVYLAVNRIAEAAALVPLHVYRINAEQRLNINHHPLETLLDAPNPFMSRFELMEQTLGFLELTGNAYWCLVGDAHGRPVEIWPLRPDRVAIVPHPERHIAGYLYEIDGQRIPLETAEVVHFKRWHPANDYYGLSALEAARHAVESDRAMAAWNRSTFSDDHAVPAGIVTIKEHISDADFERIKREWRASYGGAQRRTAFVRGGAVEWQSIGLSHSELDFLQGRKAHRDEILTLFGIPVGLISENATEANATVAERLFIERTLWPKLVRIAQKITQELLPFWDADCVAAFEDIRPTDQHARLDEMRAAHGVLTVNEMRGRYFKLPPVPWGDSPEVSTLPLPAPTESESVKAADLPPLDSFGELAAWERYALKRLNSRSARAFEPRSLPAPLAFEISARLMAARSADEIRAVFRRARGMLPEDAPPDAARVG